VEHTIGTHALEIGEYELVNSKRQDGSFHSSERVDLAGGSNSRNYRFLLRSECVSHCSFQLGCGLIAARSSGRDNRTGKQLLRHCSRSSRLRAKSAFTGEGHRKSFAPEPHSVPK